MARFGLLLIAILTLSSLAIAETALGQSTPKPSAPEFALNYADNSYDVLPTTSIAPYTGETMTQAGYRAVNKSIEVTIKNVPPSNYGAYYSIQAKGHYENESAWKTVCTSQALAVTFVSEEEGYYYARPKMPDSSLLWAPSGGEVDFRVMAMVGEYVQVPDTQPQMPWSNGYKTVFVGENSDWSGVQTLKIPEEPPLNVLVTFVVAVTAAAVACAGLLLYFKKRRRQSLFPSTNPQPLETNG